MKKDGVCGKRKWKKEVEVGSGQQHKLNVERSGFSLRLTVVKCTTYEFSTNNHHIL
jgi:hypothetical protein